MEKLLEMFNSMLNSSGNTWLKEDEVFTQMKKLRLFKTDLINCIKAKKIVCKTLDNKNYYTTLKFYRHEKIAAQNVVRILKEYVPPNISDEKLYECISNAEKKLGISLHEQQREAVFGATKYGLYIITGGPGTGKTSVLQALIDVLYQLKFDVEIRLTAPTGKAARRITESTKRMAKTIQKLLGLTETKKYPNKFLGDVLIVDEVSMLDMETTQAVLESIHNGRKLIFVGDIEQLPSVAPGAILRDMLESEVVPFTMLTKTFRQKAGSVLAENIALIKNGNANLLKGPDFEMIEIEDDPVSLLVDMFVEEAKEYGLYNIALLLPYRKSGILCSNYMNNVIQKKINPSTNYFESSLDNGSKVHYAVNDPVIQLENRAECVNGDVGIIKEIKNNSLIVAYDDGKNMVEYEKEEIPQQLSLAYALSINKSQGSEYPSVIMCISETHERMLNRNLLYTGVTRAKKKIRLLYDEMALYKSIFNEETNKRTTLFAEEIKDEFERRKYE